MSSALLYITTTAWHLDNDFLNLSIILAMMRISRDDQQAFEMRGGLPLGTGLDRGRGVGGGIQPGEH